MKMEDALEFCAKTAKELGAEQFDFMAGSSRSLGVTVFQGKVQNTEISESMGLGIRVFCNKRPGYAFTERITAQAVEQTLRDAIAHCEFTDAMPIELPEPCELPVLAEPYAPELENLDLPTMTAKSMELESKIFAGSSEISNIPWLGMGHSFSRTWFYNHKGVRESHRENSFSLGAGAVGLRKGISKMGIYTRAGRNLSWADTGAMSKILVERALELLDARPIASAQVAVVFSNRVSGQLLSMFQSPFFADSVQKGQSRLVNRLGQVVASPCVNLCSHPFCPELPGSEVIDGEGVVPRPLDILSEGVLQSYLYNLESAMRDAVPSTGSASRGWSGKVGTGFSNFLVSPGSMTEQELLQVHPRCLLVVKLEGGTGCSSVSGEISIGAQGFWVERGEKVHPVDRITLSGNFFDLLQNIEAVGNEYNDSFSSVRVPAILVSTLAVSS